MKDDANVGRNVPRREGRAKLTGSAVYIDDMHLDGMWHGVTVRSPVARGTLRDVEFAADFPWHECCVVTAKDIPGKNAVALLTYDQPFLADGVVNHPEEPVLLIAHPDKHVAEAARAAVKLIIDPLPAVFSLDEALAAKTIVWGSDNVFKRYEIKKGDSPSVFARDGVIVVEGQYETGAQEQLYIENNGVIAQYSATDGVTVWGSMQCPYYVHKGLMPLFGLPDDKVRIIQAETGGGFGGKEEYPTLIAGHAALLAMKCGKPVKLVYDRAEDMVATTKRHPSRTTHRTALSRDGKILAMEIDFVIDGGAYNTLSPVVLSRGTIHSVGPYLVPHVTVRSRAVATNTPPHGAFRGFGAPQSIFALERHLDRCAERLGLEPHVLRERNFLRTGDATATSQTIKEPLDMHGIMHRAFAESDYLQQRERFAAHNAKPGMRKKGIGFATFMHGAGFTGSGEKTLASVVGAEATRHGTIRVLAASTEIGQGTNTVFAQIASDALGLPLECVEVVQPDTAHVPNSGPTVASRTTMVVGKLVQSAAIGIEQTLTGLGLYTRGQGHAAFQRACAAFIDAHGPLKSFSEYKQPAGVEWDDQAYRGEAYATYAWACYVASVTVDLVTFETQVDDFVAVQEIGRVIHPLLAAGQIEGGVAQGIGYALYEKVVWRDGRMANGQMTNYIMPTAADAPPIRVMFLEAPTEHGPFGAKGIGELPMDGPAPALLAAIEQATGVRPTAIPLLPEDLMQLMKTRSAA